MATLKGPGSMTGLNLTVTTFPNGVHKNKEGKVVTQFADVSVNMDDPRHVAETDPHLTTKWGEFNGKKKADYGAAYSTSQMDAIVAAAGENFVVNKNGSTTFGVKADVFPPAPGKGLIIKTDSVAPSDIAIDAETKNRHFEAAAANREVAKEAAAAAKAAGEPAVVAPSLDKGPEAESGEAAALEGAEEPSMS